MASPIIDDLVKYNAEKLGKDYLVYMNGNRHLKTIEPELVNLGGKNYNVFKFQESAFILGVIFNNDFIDINNDKCTKLTPIEKYSYQNGFFNPAFIQEGFFRKPLTLFAYEL